jgi:hypothetical protein
VAGNSGLASSTGVSGTGGGITLTAGNAGTSAGGATSGAGGAVGITAGNGGGGTPTAAGNGGAITLTAGTGGTGTTGGNGGAVNIYTGIAGTGGSPTAGALAVNVGGASGTTVLTASATGQTSLCRGVRTQPIVGNLLTDYDAQAATLTIAGLLGGLVTQNSQTGASTATTPTGAEISAGITGVATGDSFYCAYYNRGNQTSTITAGASGVTVYGTAAITTTKMALLYFYCSGANTWSCYVVASA